MALHARRAVLHDFLGRPGLQLILRMLYYLAILAALLVLYGRGDFSTPPFIYQGF